MCEFPANATTVVLDVLRFMCQQDPLGLRVNVPTRCTVYSGAVKASDCRWRAAAPASRRSRDPAAWPTAYATEPIERDTPFATGLI